MRHATRLTATKQLAFLAPFLLVIGCETLDQELPMETVISWPALEWQPVPPEHEPYVGEMVDAIETVVVRMDSVHAELGHYGAADLIRLRGNPAEGVKIVLTSAAEYAYIYAFHIEAPGSGCIVRLGERPLTRYTDDPMEEPSPVLFAALLRMPDAPGDIECMRTKSREELRPRITRRPL